MARPLTFDIYRDVAGEWRWRIVAANGRIVASSGEAFASRSNATRATHDLIRGLADAAPVSLSPGKPRSRSKT